MPAGVRFVPVFSAMLVKGRMARGRCRPQRGAVGWTQLEIRFAVGNSPLFLFTLGVPLLVPTPFAATHKIVGELKFTKSPRPWADPPILEK